MELLRGELEGSIVGLQRANGGLWRARTRRTTLRRCDSVAYGRTGRRTRLMDSACAIISWATLVISRALVCWSCRMRTCRSQSFAICTAASSRGGVGQIRRIAMSGLLCCDQFTRDRRPFGHGGEMWSDTSTLRQAEKDSNAGNLAIAGVSCLGSFFSAPSIVTY